MLSYKTVVWGILLLALALAAFVSPWASRSPDGLERVAEDQGFIAQGEGKPTWQNAPLPDYAVPLVHNPSASTALAGSIGTLVVFAAGWAGARMLHRKKPPTPTSTTTASP